MQPTKMQVIKAQEGYNEVGQIVEVLYTTGSMSKCYNPENGYYYLTRSENLQPMYKWTDISDEEDFQTGTLQQARQWLADFWLDNPFDEEDVEEDYSEEEHQAEIMGADASELNDKMGGIGYYLTIL